MNEISQDEIFKGLLAHGFFSERLPPLFTAKPFFDFCQSHEMRFPKEAKNYIYHESMRNTNVPRPFGIPHPAVYYHVCKYISEIWVDLQNYFEQATENQGHKISHRHIRKMKDTPMLFVMNYSKWGKDGSPEPDLLIGKKYQVCADISNCFPSIYTHALSWALVGKEEAKKNIKDPNTWYNKLDRLVRNLKDGETHGLLIGPHLSNLLSEIIFVKIDKELYDNWKYIRNIDDYTCYVSSYEDGQKFLVELSEQLRAYDLHINNKKTVIKKLPIPSDDRWTRKLKTLTEFETRKKVTYTTIRYYLDVIIELMQKNNDNAAVLNYAMKIIATKKLSDNAKDYYVKTILHLTVLFPYLVTLLEDCLFKPFDVETTLINNISNLLYEEGIKSKNYEVVYYALYYAMKYELEISDLNFDTVKKSQDCLFLLLAYLYSVKNKKQNEVKAYKKYAQTLKQTDEDSFWLFIYEVLPENELQDYWKAMKRNKISFLKKI